MKIAVVIGTRPEAVKSAPVILELKRRGIGCVVITTAQHRQMLDDALEVFAIRPDYDLNLMKEAQDLAYITASSLEGVKSVLLKEQPSAVLAQGDTATTFSASLAAFYLGIPVGHIEAGLRTGDMANPFPEEALRQLTSRITTFHFAPTERAKSNLLKEGINESSIYVTGNTVVDALTIIAGEEGQRQPSEIAGIDFTGKRVILLTAHRRENFGNPLREIFSACRDVVERYSDVEILYPVHPNPNVQSAAREVLQGVERIRCVEPLSYRTFLYAMKRCYCIVTDSGGLQEEAPTFGKPVLVLRTTTERQEAIEAGTAKLIGTERQTVSAEIQRLLDDARCYAGMIKQENPFGDGKAAQRIADILIERLSGTAL